MTDSADPISNFLGFDLSTQKLKAVVVDKDLNIIHESYVDFDRQLPEFRTQEGAIKGDNGVVTTPVALWVKAFDLLLDQMKIDGVDFSKIKALSGAAQQHGSIYWQKNARITLNNLDSSQFLYQQLQSCFSLKQSPIWMDSSSSKYCKEMEEAVGGSQAMAEITGSRACERFTGPQIAKIADQRPSVYENTERISLVSSFACSLFLGDYASMDYADASSMNLMNIKTNDWHDMCIEATKTANLKEKLGKPVPPHTDLGNISKYFAERFGFNTNCRIISFTGDNPATLAGMRLSENDMAISLGTSDTVILSLAEPKVFINGHVMRSPTEIEGFMGLLCFKNGSLIRERFKNFYANGSWEEFNCLLDSTPRGNFGNFGLYFDSQEILPFVKKGEYKWNAKGEKVTKFASPEIEIRALIEGQFIARRSHAEDLGLLNKQNSRIIATGGASGNKSILQVLSDVFNLPVYTQFGFYGVPKTGTMPASKIIANGWNDLQKEAFQFKSRNSAALGAAYLAKMGAECNASFRNLTKQLSEFELICEPNKDSVQIYNPMLKKYRALISSLP